MSRPRDYYDILGVPRSATAEEIKKAFRKQAKTLHPDTSQDPDAEHKFKELGEAYDVLSDAQKRQTYDTYGYDGLKSGGYTPGWDFAEGFPDLSDLFSSFFGGFGGGGFGGRRGGPRRGDDLRTDLQLTFHEAAFGAKKEVEVHRMAPCEPCQGSGAAPGSGAKTCQTCGGAGQVQQTAQTILGHFTQITVCPTCQGQGSTIAEPCTHCHGKARVAQQHKLAVTVPPGVDHGTRLRVGGEGDAGLLGGPPGDLYVVIHAAAHPQFQRDGYNVLSVQPVRYTDLVLGAEIETPGLEGSHKLKIAPGTPTGHVVHLRRMGIPYLQQPNQRGDHLVQLQVEIPKHPSGEEKKLLHKLQELERQKAPLQDTTASSLFEKMRGAFST